MGLTVQASGLFVFGVLVLCVMLSFWFNSAPKAKAQTRNRIWKSQTKLAHCIHVERDRLKPPSSAQPGTTTL